MPLTGARAAMLMVWMASGGVGGNTQPGEILYLDVFCADEAVGARATGTGGWEPLGPVCCCRW
ncbi:cysteine/glutathione ABC transporter ATP-binding protein/permease CydC, partial [Salmonella enterica subsp. enterica serovar Poona]